MRDADLTEFLKALRRDVSDDGDSEPGGYRRGRPYDHELAAVLQGSRETHSGAALLQVSPWPPHLCLITV